MSITAVDMWVYRHHSSL